MCVFCNIDKIQSDKIEYRGSNNMVMIFEPLNPVVPGHLLVVNKRHSKDFTDKPMIFAETAKVAAEVAADRGGAYNLITSKGEEATQSVFHCYIHLVPRHQDDGLKLPWS
jgi:histidine triad (HIT) family protein